MKEAPHEAQATARRAAARRRGDVIFLKMTAASKSDAYQSTENEKERHS
jgi:hypothetical protein